jgi:GNAT superfamily N-acetyltransferase
MVLTSEPPPVSGVVVRRVDSPSLAHAAVDVNVAAGVIPQELVSAMHESVDRAPAAATGGAPSVSTFLAFLDGTPAAVGTSWYGEEGVYLAGGATAPDLRGRGVYRALIHARWEDALGRGKSGLVAQAGAMSRDILARLGFEAVCELHAYEDSTGEA